MLIAVPLRFRPNAGLQETISPQSISKSGGKGRHTVTDNNHGAGSRSALILGLTLIAALGGLLFGYDTAVISGAVGAIDANYIDPRGLTETAADSLSGWAISCALLGCIIGAFLAGPATQRFGRRGGLIISALLFLV